MTTFRTNVAPIIPEIPSDSTPEQARFFKGIQDLLSENYRATRQDLNALDSSVSGLIAYKQKKTYNTPYGFWGDVWYKDADEIVIKPKSINGLSWMGGVFSDNSYVESSTAITAKLAVPGSSGHIVDGITAVLNNSWYILWLYNNAGTITPAFTLMPITTFSNANPTDALTLNTVNAQNIGYLYPVGSHIVVWQDGDEFETPYFFSQDGGGTTVDVTADKPKLASRTATVLTLGASLTNATFTAGSYVYQVDNFKPLQLSDGAIAAAIGTNGYLDTGIRIRTDGSGNIVEFFIADDWYIFNCADSEGIETITPSSTYTVYRFQYLPPDKTLALCNAKANYGAAWGGPQIAMYYNTTGRWMLQGNNIRSGGEVLAHCAHGLIKAKFNAYGETSLGLVGYKI